MVENRLIVEQFDPLRPKPGGIDTCIRGLVKFAPSHIRLRIVGVDAVGDKRLGEWMSCHVDGVDYEFMPVVRLDHANLSRLIPHSVRLVRGIRRYLRGEDVDVIQSHRINVGGQLLRLFPGTPHVQFLHSSGVENLQQGSKSFFRRAQSLYRRMEATVIPRSEKVVVFSSSGAERLSEQFGDHVTFSPTWFDPELFYPAESGRPRGHSVVWACRIEPAKNPLLAIAGFETLHDDYRLTVAGSGTMEQDMRRAATKSPAADRIQFLGSVAKSQMGALLRDHDSMLMTSRFEGYSRSVVEGLASGLPVVTTPGGEPNGLVVDGVNGARLTSDDSSLLAAAFERARSVTATAARASVEHLSAASIVPELLLREQAAS